MFATWDVAAEPIRENLAMGGTSIDVDRLRRHTEAFRKRGPNVIAGLNSSPNFRGRRRLLVEMDQHGRTPSQSSLRTDLAMNSADRRGLM